MRRFLITVLSLLLFGTILFADNIKIINKTKDFITLEVNFSDYQIRQFDDYTAFKTDSWELNGEPKAPMLPIKEIKVIVPENGDINLSILDKKMFSKRLSKPILPAPTPVKGEKTTDFLNIIDKQKYENYYKNPITKKEKTVFRHYEYVPIIISPVIFGKNTNEIKIYSKILLQIKIIGDTDYSKNFDDKLSSVSKAVFINYEQAKFWQNPIKKTKIDKLDFSQSDFWYKFSIKNFGINKIPSSVLKILPEFADLKTIRLFKTYKNKNNKYIKKEIPIEIVDNSIIFENTFDNDRKKQGSTIFWLTFGGEFSEFPLRNNINLKGKSVNNIKSLKKVRFDKKYKSKEQTDCLIIYPSVFRGLAEQLADFHNEKLNTKTVIAKQEDIVNEYAGGYADPYAIRQFVQNVYQNWDTPKLQYLILLGTGTYEGLIGFDDITLSEWYNLNSKNKMLTDGGGKDDYFANFSANVKRPQIAVSRLPFKSAQQFDIYYERMEKYFTSLPSGWWQNKITILADDELHSGGYEGMSGSGTFNHTYYSQLLQNNLSPLLDIDKVLGINYPLDEYNTKPGATNELIKRINEGRLIWTYLGHGNHDVLGDESYFVGSDIERLYNKEHLPLFVAGSCNVGEFDNPNFDCIGERILYGEHGGAIASVTASRGCGPGANYYFILNLLSRMVNLNTFDNLGEAILYAKLNSSNYSNDSLFNLFANLLLEVIPPKLKGAINFSNFTGNNVSKRQTCLLNGNFQSTVNYYEGDLRVYESPKWVNYTNYNYVINDTIFYSVDYTLEPSSIYKGKVTVNDNRFDAGFIVPDETNAGPSAKILCYTYDEETNSRILSAKAPFSILNTSVDSVSTQKPDITIWVDSEKFKPGDTVSSSPTVYAEISDENGINITGAAGRKILLLMITPQNKEILFDMTNNFEYDENSFTSGKLEYKLNNLDEGVYNLSVFAYDNFGDWSSKDTYFKVKKSSKIQIYDDLVYPNPMGKDGGMITFLLSEAANVTIDIYTITGKKIKHLSAFGCDANYNQINWNGRDEDGDVIANGTYFYRIKAVSLETKKSAKKIGKFIIEK